jgi:replicative DNA helicase
MKDDIRLVIVDHIGLVRTTMSKPRHLELGEISAALKRLAKELGIPVIALAQLSRQIEGREDKRPVLSDLRESGRIEEDADIVAFLYRDEYYNKETPDKEIIEFIMRKNRMGALGTSKFKFKKWLTKIEEAETIGGSYGIAVKSNIANTNATVIKEFETVASTNRLPYVEED